MGLGGLSLVTLAEAREKALTYRKLAREGGDPFAERRKTRAVVPTFAEAAEKVHAEHKASWKNPKHAAQWLTTLKTYAIPVIGERRVDQIGTPDILKVLSPIWLTKPETARRVRQRVGTVLDWAKAAGFQTGDNPVVGVAKGLPKQTDRDEHHAALPYEEVPAFVQSLRASDNGEVVRLAFEFLILTASRTSEVLGAKWSEVDLQQRIWTVPASRMKAGRTHRVPLVERTLEILKRAKEIGGRSDYVFPSRAEAKPLSNMAFLMTLRRMKLDITAHGFRSSFRDWAAEQTNFPREVCEAALAHAVENKVEAAYRRGDLFEKRRAVRFAFDGTFDTPIYRRATITPNCPDACEGLHRRIHSA
jgi:integrase